MPTGRDHWRRRGARAAASGLALALAQPAPAFAQVLGRAEAAAIPIADVIGALLLCLILAVAAVLLLKRLKTGAPFTSSINRDASRGRKRLAVLESRRLSVHADLCLIESDGEEFLLVVGAAQSMVVRSRPQSGRPTRSDAAVSS